MAIEQSDGSIILTTKVDTSGIKNANKDINRSFDQTISRAKKTTASISSTLSNAFSRVDLSEIEKLQTAFDEATYKAEEAQKKVEKLNRKLQGLESGEIKIENADLTKTQKEFDKTSERIQNTQKEIDELYAKMDALQAGAFINPQTQEPLLSGKDLKEFEEASARLDALEPQLIRDKEAAEQLAQKLKQAYGEATRSEIESTRSKLSEAEISLEKTKAKAEQAGAALNEATKGKSEEVDKISQGFERIGKRIAGIVKRVLIFSVITKVMRSMVNLFKNILLSDKQFRQDWEELKAAFYTAAQPIVSILIPAIKLVVGVTRDWAVAIGHVIAALKGISYAELVEQAKATKQAADNYAEMANSSKKTAKNTEKQLAAFDDIQILSSKQENEEDQTEKYAGFEGLEKYDTSREQSMLNSLTKAVGGALIALGVILLFTGNIGWGIGFIIAGAVLYGVSERTGDGDFSLDTIKNDLISLAGTLKTYFIVIGIFLLFMGAFAWGIGFIIAGAVLYGVEEAETNKYDGQDIITKLAIIGEAVSLAIVTIGVILLFFGNISWGLGFILLGAVGLGVSEEQLNKDGVTTEIQKLFEEFKDYIVGAAVAMLVIGIILLFIPGTIMFGIKLIAGGAAVLAAAAVISNTSVWGLLQEFFQKNAGLIAGLSAALLVIGILVLVISGGTMLALGISLIAAGAVGLVAVVVVNWDAIKEKVVEIFNKVKDWVVTYGLLVIGIILCLTGVGLPMGIALIIKWAKDNAENVPLANAIFTKVKEIWNKVKEFWDAHIAQVFTAKFWLDLAKKCGNGLITGFENAINGIIGMFEKMINWIVDGLNKISIDVPDWVPLIGGKTFGFNIPEVKFGRVSIPRLAQGAVIPANREFLAVLGDQKRGTNIEAPAELIKQMVMEAMMEMGGNFGNSNTEVVLEIDGREFGRAVVEQGNRENRRIGTKLVIA